jgi:hypothetical protein
MDQVFAYDLVMVALSDDVAPLFLVVGVVANDTDVKLLLSNESDGEGCWERGDKDDPCRCELLGY